MCLSLFQFSAANSEFVCNSWCVVCGEQCFLLIDTLYAICVNCSVSGKIQIFVVCGLSLHSISRCYLLIHGKMRTASSFDFLSEINARRVLEY